MPLFSDKIEFVLYHFNGKAVNDRKYKCYLFIYTSKVLNKSIKKMSDNNRLYQPPVLRVVYAANNIETER